jgi:hypothetical protein
LPVITDRLAEIHGVETLRPREVFALFFFAVRYDRAALRSLT